MTELELLIDFHKEGPRQGPGGRKQTLKALSLLNLDENSQHKSLKIADIGCGTGAQTLDLAQHIDGEIVAVDLFPKFLEKLEKKARESGLSEKITSLCSSMENLPFGEEEFDIIWSEGAIYLMGFENGLKTWKPFLKKKGFLVVSEISWLTHSRPKELEEYWHKNYPQIDVVSKKTEQLEKNGYVPIAHFVLPPNCWLQNYYQPMQARFQSFLTKHHNKKTAKELIKREQEEIALYEKFKNDYSYGFYIAKKI